MDIQELHWKVANAEIAMNKAMSDPSDWRVHLMAYFDKYYKETEDASE
jgi:hypothetical protein